MIGDSNRDQTRTEWVCRWFLIHFEASDSDEGGVTVDNSLTRLQKFDGDFLHSKETSVS